MKKLLSILMALSLLAGVCAVSVSADDDVVSDQDYWIAETPDVAPEEIPGEIIGKLGDTDKSDAVNVKDATSIQKFVASLVDFTNDVKILADTDLSGDITVRDATAIQKWIAGLAEDMLIGNYVYRAFAPDPELLGSWETTIDMADLINGLIASLAEDTFVQEYISETVPGFTEYYLIPENINIETCPLKATYTFNDDSSYALTVDEEVLAQTMAIVKEDLTGDVENFIKAYAEVKNLPLTPDMLMGLMGYDSVEDFIDEMFPEDMIGEYIAPIEGYYRTAPQGKLYLDEYSDTVYETYTVEGDTLTITGTNEEISDDMLSGIVNSMYPMVFTRVK